MNRIFIHLRDTDARKKRQREALRGQLAHIRGITEGLVDIFVSEDLEIRYCVNWGDPDGDMATLPAVQGAESLIATELRRFSGLCVSVAEKLEGGAV